VSPVTACFADTFFFLALLNSQDRQHHSKARDANRAPRAVVTSHWVLLELADHLCDRRNRHLYGQVLDALTQDRRYTILPADQTTLEQATQLYRDRADKEWSLTDCTSFVIMQREGLVDALTADQHFEQAGFAALLK
jgi:uncharacterized protein